MSILACLDIQIILRFVRADSRNAVAQRTTLPNSNLRFGTQRTLQSICRDWRIPATHPPAKWMGVTRSEKGIQCHVQTSLELGPYLPWILYGLQLYGLNHPYSIELTLSFQEAIHFSWTCL